MTNDIIFADVHLKYEHRAGTRQIHRLVCMEGENPPEELIQKNSNNPEGFIYVAKKGIKADLALSGNKMPGRQSNHITDLHPIPGENGFYYGNCNPVPEKNGLPKRDNKGKPVHFQDAIIAKYENGILDIWVYKGFGIMDRTLSETYKTKGIRLALSDNNVHLDAKNDTGFTGGRHD
ncbi:hypothetical protein K7I13_11820 [Brucepastera parasyntrophica]|uniref:hypothetical protein n=1 Tax=Brucepastera parasyntrophica TaxID=2880008 RepID=UPI00210C8BCE|nr:hypothetical protein [Brucepastera parasyntrophica]ULQ59176.1 hypothetical protein K7I13_11820 [Brucepastera parasyntrophica]